MKNKTKEAIADLIVATLMAETAVGHMVEAALKATELAGKDNNETAAGMLLSAAFTADGAHDSLKAYVRLSNHLGKLIS